MIDRAPEKPNDQRRMAAAVGNLLRAGIVAAAATVLGGAALYLVRHGNAAADYAVFSAEPSDLRSVAGILEDVLALKSRGILQFGFLLLIATPILRVVAAGIGFLRQRDWLYVGVVTGVLGILTYSLFGGH
jgi:uncharacterized membrane protein